MKASEAANLDVASFHAPKDVVPAGDPIVDVARLGPPTAMTSVVLTCGTWEDEGLCASGIQTALIEEGLGNGLTDDVGLVLVHAVAPPGLSGLGKRSPALMDLPDASAWSNSALAAAEHRFASYLQGTSRALAVAGNNSVPWQARLLCQIADRFFGLSQRIMLIDLRTGPGNYGEADILACRTGSEASLDQTAQIIGHDAEAGPPLAQGVPGDLACGLIAALERADLAAAVLEFGTYSMRSVLAAGDRRVFYPDHEDWREQTYGLATSALQRIFTALSGA